MKGGGTLVLAGTNPGIFDATVENGTLQLDSPGRWMIVRPCGCRRRKCLVERLLMERLI